MLKGRLGVEFCNCCSDAIMHSGYSISDLRFAFGLGESTGTALCEPVF